MDAQPNQSGLNGAGRPFKIAFAVSVAINLAVVGIVGGIALHRHEGLRGDMGFGPFDEALRPQDRDALRTSMAAHLGDLKAARSAMQNDIGAILAALRTDPLDASALTDALEAQTQHLESRLRLGSSVMRDYLLSMQAADRKAFADRLEDRMRRGRDEKSADAPDN